MKMYTKVIEPDSAKTAKGWEYSRIPTSWSEASGCGISVQPRNHIAPPVPTSSDAGSVLLQCWLNYKAWRKETMIWFKRWWSWLTINAWQSITYYAHVKYSCFVARLRSGGNCIELTLLFLPLVLSVLPPELQIQQCLDQSTVGEHSELWTPKDTSAHLSLRFSESFETFRNPSNFECPFPLPSQADLQPEVR